MKDFDSCAELSEDNFEESGIQILALTAYYFVVAPFGSANVTSRNTHTPAVKKQKPYVTVIGKKLNSFIYSIAAFYVKRHFAIYRKAKKENTMYFLEIQKFIIKENLQKYIDLDINLSNMPNIHKTLKKYTIGVFGNSGMLFYFANLDHIDIDKEGSKDIIKLNWTGSEFKLIIHLKSFLKIKTQKTKFCFFCRKVHGENCEQVVVPGHFELRPVPENNYHHLVMYADFEAYIDKETQVHNLSGFSVLGVERNGKEIVGYKGLTKNIIQTDNDLLDEFFEIIFKILNSYQKDLGYSEIGKCDNSECKNTNIFVFRSYITGTKVYLCKKHLYKETVPIYFHNFNAYDSKFIINYCHENNFKVNIFSRNANKIDQITLFENEKPWLRIKFCDTLGHLLSSLAALAKTIVNWRDIPTDYKESFENNKGEFPYDWFDSPDKLLGDIPREKENWFSKIKQKYGDHKAAIRFYNEKNFENFGQYHNYYNKLDTILLMLVFEQYRDSCIDTHNVDPVYLFGAPSLALYIAYFANPKKYIAPSLDIYMIVQENIRGGVSQVVKRHVRRGRKDYICMLDVNALYSYAMTQPLPYRFYKEYDTLYWAKDHLGDGFCSLFLVDLEYPSDLHDDECHRQYPLAPHKFNGRLCTTFLKKERYLVHEKNLKFYLQHGLKISQCYKTYVFYEDYVMKDFIIKNIELRNKPDTPKPVGNLCKLLNNSLYGKTCENIWKYKNIIVKPIDEAPPPNSTTCNFINDTNVVYAANYEKVIACKPIQLGFSILEISKMVLYEFFYKLKKVYFKHKVDLLYTDTDSLLLHFKDLDKHPYHHLNELPGLKEKVDIPVIDGKFGPPTKQIGLLSDDKEYKQISEFVGLRAKCYAINFDDDSEILKNKGVTAAARVDDKKITFRNYKNVLYENINQKATQFLISKTRKKYELRTVEQHKLALNTYDGKHLYLEDKITTIPFGYKGKKYRRLYASDDFNNTN